MSSKLKEILLQESGLLSLSQSDCDLFLIGQVNAITYRQLALTGLHGSTATGGRLSIKRLEKEGYVASRFLLGNAREKYYMRLPSACFSCFPLTMPSSPALGQKTRVSHTFSTWTSCRC